MGITFTATNPSPKLAFRLLCEAKQACGDTSQAELNGITIHAPKTLKDWLEPFGKAEGGDISQVAAMIGGGDVKTKVEAVLNAVRNGDSISTAIGDFLHQGAPTSEHK